jgi:hypothetical protein
MSIGIPVSGADDDSEAAQLAKARLEVVVKE